MTRRLNYWFDRWAIGLSGLCLLHCLFGGVALAIVSAGGSTLFGHDVHQIGLAIAFPLALFGLVGGAARHGRWQAVALGGFGLGAMGAALLAGHGLAEAVFTMIGVSFVGIAHWFNMRWAHRH